MDDRGRLCLVEVKNEGNPDTRRVVAQLFDYAASLWGLSVEEFQQRVLHPFLAANGWLAPLPTVAEYFAEATQRDADSANNVADQLAQTLAAGDFALVVAAPQIPVGVQRVLEYLNARGQRLFGLEVSYFRGPVECFVPRLVVKPLISDPRAQAPFDEAQAQLAAIGVGGATKDGWYYVWSRHVPQVAPLQGRHLRGRVTHVASGREVDVDLVPLANAQPGWRPRFRPSSARDDVWPAESTGQEFRLLVVAASP
jgi:hypothetical protein